MSDSDSSEVIPQIDGCSIDDLPNEILLCIFSFFNQKQLCLTIKPVCSRWKRLARHASLWSEVHFICKSKRGTDSFCKLLSNYPLLSDLTFGSMGNFPELFDDVSTYFRQLTHLTLKISELTNSFLNIISLKCKRLESLNLDASTLTEIFDQSSFTCNSMPNLKSLNISYCIWVTNDLIVDIATSECKLEYLNIDGISYIDDESITSVINGFSPYLQEFIIDGEEVSDVSMNMISKCTQLSRLSISFGEKICSSFLEIASLIKLKYLRIRKARYLTSDVLQKSFSFLGFQYLFSLNLSECSGLDAAAMKSIACSAPALRHVDFSWCFELCAEGIEALFACCPLLETVILIGVLSVSNSLLKNMLLNLPNLSLLNLEQVPYVTDVAITEAVEQRHKTIKIINYYGLPFDNITPL